MQTIEANTLKNLQLPKYPYIINRCNSVCVCLCEKVRNGRSADVSNKTTKKDMVRLNGYKAAMEGKYSNRRC